MKVALLLARLKKSKKEFGEGRILGRDMSSLRVTTFVLSLMLHLSVAVPFVTGAIGQSKPPSFHAGTGDDEFRIEAAIALDGPVTLGEATETIEAIEAQDVPLVAPQEIVEDVKVSEEEPEVTDVITADADPVDETVVLEEVVKKEPPPKQVALLEPIESIKAQVATSGEEQEGGKSSERTEYLGKLSEHIQQFKVNPRTRLTGLVIVRLKVAATGEVLSREVVKSSGSKRLDLAALETIDRAAPFPAAPDGVVDRPLIIQQPFRFTIR